MTAASMCCFSAPAIPPAASLLKPTCAISGADVFTPTAQEAIRRGEVCPVWPGQPVTAHWGIEDPAAVTGSDDIKRAAVMKAFSTLQKRIALLTSLRLDSPDRLAMQQHLKRIGNER